MTQDELDAIPEAGMTFGMAEEVIDGRTVRRRPVLQHTVGALYHPPDEPISVVDQHGVGWLLGYANGVRYKRRMP